MLCALAGVCVQAAPPTLEDILKPSLHEIVKISPDGKYVAATVRKPENKQNRMLLVIIDRATNKPVRVLDPEEKAEISRVWWVNNERLFVMSTWGGGDVDNVQQYYLDPRVIAINVDGTRIRSFYAAIVDTLIDDDKHILIERCAKKTHKGCMSYVQKVVEDRWTGPRIVDAPALHSSFLTDNAGNVLFATAWGEDLIQKVWIRKGEGWEIFNDESQSGVEIELIGTSRDNSKVFILSERKEGPDVVERMDLATRERVVVMSDPKLDPAFIVWSADGRQPIGAAYGLGVPRSRFWDANDPDAKLLRGLEMSFPDDAIAFSNGSRDGRYIVVTVWSDRDPGSFYLLDRETKRMDMVARMKPWLNPAALARNEPITFTTRDDLELHGYLTMPQSAALPPPLVVMPHGGPFGVTDEWAYDEESQILAANGYAVLRVNYRGSGGFGQAFERSGYRQWGLKIMDDIVDGTRWAMNGGRIDPKRVCIWGTSFGGYAALRGVTREPDLYRCAISTAGATNLNITRKWGDTHQSEWGRTYLDMAVGDDEKALFDQSPVKHVASIKANVLLIHGNHDKRVSFEHARAMVAAMEKAGKPMETFFFDDETHGIYGEENRREYYGRVLKFLSANLGTE